MVKITDPNKNNKIKYDDKPIKKYINNDHLTPDAITELVKPIGKPETTQLNIRIEKDLNDQIDTYAKEHGTTKTTILTDIINKHYTNKRITKGAFTLNKPVTLRIPRNKQVIKEYIEQEVNIIGNTIEVTPTINDKLNRNKYQEVTITQGNNLYDEYNTTHEYYYFKSLPKYMDKFYGSLYHLILDGFIDEMGNAMINELLHRGLTLITFTDDEENIVGVFIDVIYMGNELLGAYIIDPDEAIKIAEGTGNRELIQYINSMDTYLTLNDLLKYTRSNKEYRQELELADNDLIQLKNKLEETLSENKKLKEKNTELENELKLEKHNSKKILRSWKKEQNHDKGRQYYVDKSIALEEENHRLCEKIKEYEENEQTLKKNFNDVKEYLLRQNKLLDKILTDNK